MRLSALGRLQKVPASHSTQRQSDSWRHLFPKGMEQQQQGGANMVTTTPTAVSASTWSNDFYSSQRRQEQHLHPQLPLLHRVYSYYYRVYSYYYHAHVQALASATSISSAALRVTPQTARTAALPARLHLTLHQLAQPRRSTHCTRRRHQLARHLHHRTGARIPINGRPGRL